MIDSKIFELGDFSSKLSMHTSPDSALSGFTQPSLLITDEHVYNRFDEFFPEIKDALSRIALVRSESDICSEELAKNSATANSGADLSGRSAALKHIHAIVVLPGGEAAKKFSSVDLILKTAFALSFARDSQFIAIGGGAVTDVAAFASSLFMRGNRLVLIPSTLLSMVDAAFGGKTGINYFGYKNMVGTFYPAHEVRVTPSLLKTLPQREFLSGLAEVIKSAMLDDADLFDLLEARREDVLARDGELLQTVIWRSLMVKGRVVVADLRESGIRAHLNLGHTFAHALEAMAGLGQWSHGEAVAWGIQRALVLGQRLGLTDAGYAERAGQLLRDYGYRLDASGCEKADLISAMKNDKKKSAGRVRFVLQRSLCDTLQLQVDDNDLLAVLN